MGIKRIGLIALMFLSILTVSAAKDVTFTAQAPKAVVVGDNFRLEYTVNASNAKKMRMASIEGFQILAGPSTSTRSSTSINNGKIESSSTVTYTYVLVGEEVGEYTIPGATVEVGGETYTSNSLKIKVLPQDSQSQSTSQQSRQRQQQNAAQSQPSQSSSSSGNISNSDLFMRAIVSKTRVYEQEALLLTFKVYSLVNLRSLSNKMPDLKNFHVQEVELPQNKEFELEHYNGRNYQTLVWSQYVLFPQQSGDLEIPATSFEGVVAQPIESNDIFDMFFNGGRYVETKKDLTTSPVTIHVDALPAGKTSAFMGGVGDFSISSSISTENLKANEAVTVTVVISGTGNMKLVKTPELKYPQDFDIYDPKVDNRFSLKTTGQSGNKVFEYLAIPRNAGQYVIPAVEFQYFDVASKSYKTLKTQEYTLNVEKGEGSEASTISGYVSKEDLKFVGQDVRFHNTTGKLIQPGNMFFESYLFWILLLLPLIILMLLVTMYRKRIEDTTNVVQTKRKKANSVATKRLKTVRKLMTENKKDEFYDETFKALCGYVGDKLSIPVAELSKDNIASQLRERGVNDQIINQLTQLISDCEFARYAPGDDSGRMDQIYNESAAVIGQMENSIKH